MITDDRAQKRVRIIVADSHPRVREEICKLLRSSSGLVIVGEAGDGREVLALAAQAAPDILLLDTDIEDPSALDVIHQIRQGKSTLCILAMCSECGDGYVATLMRLGADAAILKEEGAELFPAAIYQVLQGKKGRLSLS